MKDDKDNSLLPPSLMKSIKHALELVEADPIHHLDWHYRREMYKTFGSNTDSIVLRVRGWLAVLAAQYVLPIFENRLWATPISDDPDFEGLLRRVLATAINILEGSADKQMVADVTDDAYQTFGIWNMGGSDPSFSIKADAAGFSSYKAILEAGGNLEPFANAERFSRGVNSTGNVFDMEFIRGEQFTDSDWATIAGCGDTAGCAAVAYACETNDITQCDPQKLRDYWTWWLFEAIPKAWEIVVYR